jgi:hypothetical protein
MEVIAVGEDALQEAQSGRNSRFFSLAILLDLVVSNASYWSSNKEVLGPFP